MKQTKIIRFWNWFWNEGKIFLRSACNEQETINFIREIEQELFTCFGKGLRVELSLVDGIERTATLIFTASGNARFFYKIEKLLDNAPLMPGWNFVELMPPVKIDYNILMEFAGVHIDPFDCWFDSAMALDFRQRFVVAVYLKMEEEITPALENALTAILFNVLGERVYGNELGGVHIGNLLALPPEEQQLLVNLQELPDYFQLSYAFSLSVTGAGKLVATRAKYNRW